MEKQMNLFDANGDTVADKRKDRIEELKAIIKSSKSAYYRGDPLITDAEYDVLEDELRSLLIEEGLDPDEVIGIGASEDEEEEEEIEIEIEEDISDDVFPKSKHNIPMGSQSKCANEKEFADWWRLKNTKNLPVLASYKMDGASLALYYENGKLKQAISRGDGKVGRDLTPNAKFFKGVLGTIPCTEPVAVRGECILSVEEWREIDEQAEKNPRNLGTGIMGREDGTNSDRLRFISFGLSVSSDEIEVDREEKKMDALKTLGLSVTPSRLCNSLDEVISFYKEVSNNRKDNAVEIDGEHYWIDGLVLSINDTSVHAELGESSGRPKWSTALKFPSPGAETILTDIEFSVGYTGTITPVGIIEPVEIGGTTIGRVTLNNWDYIKTKDVAMNDRVKIVKGGDIIPKLTHVIARPDPSRSNRIRIEEPRICPACGYNGVEREKTVIGEDCAALKCMNPYCSAKIIGRFKRIVNKLNILDMGESIITAMNQAGLIVTLKDFFTLESKRDKIAALEVGNGVWGEKRADKIIEEISKKKSMTLDVFLGMLGVSGLGQRKAKQIIDKSNGNLDSIDGWIYSDYLLGHAQELGVPKSAQVINRGLQEIVQEIKILLPVITIEKIEEQTGPLSGMSFVLTGTMSRGRKEIGADIEANGGELHSSVSKNTTYLVQADPTAQSGKTKKAAKLGVEVIGEDELETMMKNG